MRITQATGRSARMALAIAGTWLVAAASATTAVEQAKSVNDGVYTEPQAERGQKSFAATCTMCHDTARFTGPEFVKQWSGQPLGGLFKIVSTTMPEDNPGSLKPQQYGDIVAYFLKLNGYPAGAAELEGNAESLTTVTMEPKKP